MIKEFYTYTREKLQASGHDDQDSRRIALLITLEAFAIMVNYCSPEAAEAIHDEADEFDKYLYLDKVKLH